MGSRTFLRRFEDATGRTPARWLLDERLLRATQHLTHSRLSVEQIAELCGFANASTLRHHFRQQYALSPLQYRKRCRVKQTERNLSAILSLGGMW